ncbi:MAG: hypothetical protein ILP19_03455 [Oscillospiraceae bacterium]|nr:hypothetical protein [Oscillospiraceae bacterium]
MKKKFIALVLLSVPLLAGLSWGDKVQLLDGGPLIDLGEAVKVSPGGGSIAPTEGVSGGEDVSGGTQSGSDLSQTEKVVEIRIRGTEMYYDGKLLTDGFDKKLERDMGMSARFVLVDDYAEAHVYKRVRGQLNKLRDDKGLEYSEQIWGA